MHDCSVKPEILAPCGSPEALTAALRSGCDAVYLGGECFSARQNAANFSNEELKTAVFECHKRGVKVYQAINTVIFDEQLEDCKAAVRFAAEIGIDALIIQDLALVRIVRLCCPDMEIHASTQMTLHTADGIETAKEMGFSRVVLSRELPLDIIRRLSHMGIETEVFVHGALCMSVSGQCCMSAVIGSRSANRGLCAQACRLPCSAVEGKERYDLSLKDMSYLGSIKKLEAAGVSSLKIEGRMKRPEYVAKAVDSCKKALEERDYDLRELEAVFSRSGFTDGYLYGRLGREMFGVRTKEDVSAAAKALPKIHELYRRNEKRDKIFFRLYAKQGEDCVLEAADSMGSRFSVKGGLPEAAKTKGTDRETVEKSLSKLGDTIYELGGLETDIGENIWVSPAVLNSMRREVCAGLDRVRAKRNTKIVGFQDKDLFDFPQRKPAEQKQLRICVTSLSQLEQADFKEIELCGVPMDIAEQAAKCFPADKLMIVMPRFTFDEEDQYRRLEAVKKSGADKMLCTNIAHIKAARDHGFEIHLDFGFNITNSAALDYAGRLGAKDAVLSFELKASQINSMKKSISAGIFAYGRLPLMLTVNCPVSQAVGCKNCTGRLVDRTNREFKIKCSKKLGYTEIMNSDILYLADKLDSFSGADFLQLSFFDESPQEVRKIISAYKHGSDFKPDTITRGLYFRGVL